MMMKLPMSVVIAAVTLLATAAAPQPSAEMGSGDASSGESEVGATSRSIVTATCVALPSDDGLTLLGCGKKGKPG